MTHAIQPLTLKAELSAVSLSVERSELRVV
jgi:hypothetical protein